MSTFWSAWVIIITLICLVFVFYTLYLNQKNYTGVEEGEEMGHEFDGIKELNNPLPKWWRNMYWATGIWAIIYLALYPGWGNFEGFFGGWRSSNQDIRSIAESKAATEQAKAAGIRVQYDIEVEKADARFGPIFQAYADMSVAQLVKDKKALEIGQRLYLQNCSQCHGSNARGGEGFPDLTDQDWLYGGSFAKIKETILHGRKAAMPGWEASLGDQGIKDVTAYVLSLSGREAKEGNVASGKAKFAVCGACHGANGIGSLALGLPMGAPNLTDNVWLYGGSERAIQETLRHGRNGVMPAWKDILGEDKVHIISAYVYSLSETN
ncbi:cytochrome-c oxidase, cbb3-type subunit III [Saccharobesus litoralis]|uniref:Cbb3-type cytochrome c oxidase subunit n=1 Tax=Saccharobesus litoralis TaxID=2172099 RepID=A0A2S0VSZ6_9ALTE|nr:cytochrome-c oxidase, cbb3-type subunit III [Saccharobesus litoralis]AWB67335.1 cytochrome-c oxidase, cbb3-type subunit III [Saccharobesus litoralis]